MTTFTLPYPPSANRYWRNARGRIVVSAEAIAYKTEVDWLARQQVTTEMPFAGAVRLVLRFYRPRKAGDTSNRIKVLEDALEGITYINDRQVVEIHAYRYDDKYNPRVEVDVTEVTEW